MKEKTQIIIWMVLILITMCLAYIVPENKIKQNNEQMKFDSYMDGYNNGTLIIIQEINQKGEIPVIVNQTVQWINIREICGNDILPHHK